MTQGRFDYKQLNPRQQTAIEIVRTIVFGIVSHGENVYDASDVAAARDIERGLVYLMRPVTWETVTHTKEDYKRE